MTLNANRGISLVSSAEGRFIVDSGVTATIAGIISGASSNNGSITKYGSGTLSLSGTNTYTGATSITAGTLAISNASALGTTAGTTTIDSGAVLGISGGITLAENITLSGSGISSGGGISFTAGANTLSGAITLAADSLIKSTVSGSTQTISGNINGAYDLTVNTSDALTISGAIGNSTALDTIDISSNSGNITLSGNMTSTSSGSAITINAGTNTAAGTSSGGNIIISGSPVFTSSSGVTKFYTGSVSGSTGLTSLIVSGSGNFRYNADESSSLYSATTAGTKYAIYREQPTLTLDANDDTITYGDALTQGYTATSLQNGDIAGTVLTTGPSYSYSGSQSTSNNYTYGTHTISLSGAASSYGYAINYTTGTLTVDKKQFLRVV